MARDTAGHLSWRPSYAVAALIVFLAEVAIALWVRDGFVRPYLGDVLAVILIYLMLRAVTTWRIIPTALAALAVGLAVEIGQAINLLDILGLADHAVARVVFGTAFSVGDIFCYAAGAAIAMIADYAREYFAARGKVHRTRA